MAEPVAKERRLAGPIQARMPDGYDVGTRVMVKDYMHRWFPGSVVSRIVVAHKPNHTWVRIQLDNMQIVRMLQNTASVHPPFTPGIFQPFSAAAGPKVMDLLECLDPEGVWYPAYVIQEHEDGAQVLIHYEQWVSKYDEWIPRDSARLQPYGTRISPHLPFPTQAFVPLPRPLPDGTSNIEVDSHETIRFCSNHVYTNHLLQLDLECVVCFATVVCQPLHLACCGQLVCLGCAEHFHKVNGQDHVQKNRKCPACRTPFAEAQQVQPTLPIDVFLTRKIAQMHVFCAHSNNGCAWVGELGASLRTYRSHMAGCDKKDVLRIDLEASKSSTS